MYNCRMALLSRFTGKDLNIRNSFTQPSQTKPSMNNDLPLKIHVLCRYFTGDFWVKSGNLYFPCFKWKVSGLSMLGKLIIRVCLLSLNQHTSVYYMYMYIYIPNHPKSSKIFQDQGTPFWKKKQHCWKLVLSPLQMGQNYYLARSKGQKC